MVITTGYLTAHIAIAESHRALCEWFCSVDPEDEHEENKKLHAPGTGSWILENPAFVTWLDSPASVLWVTGESNPRDF